jgi:hypothetical protein
MLANHRTPFVVIPGGDILVKRIGWSTLLALIALASVLSCSDKDDGPTEPPAPLPADIQLVLVAGGFTSPVFMTQPPGDDRMFVVQKSGEIMVVDNGNTRTTPFLDITGLLTTGSEQGLLSMAFDPEYASNGRFFVCYTGNDGDVIVARYHVSANPDSAVPVADEIVLQVEHSAQPNHNGGLILFGPDDMLYVGVGDGGGANDPFNSGQNPADSLGNILRIDVSGDSGYTDPARQSERRVSGVVVGVAEPSGASASTERPEDLYIGDVGESVMEEIDVATAVLGGRPGRQLRLVDVRRVQLLPRPVFTVRKGDAGARVRARHQPGAEQCDLRDRRIRLPGKRDFRPGRPLLLRRRRRHVAAQLQVLGRRSDRAHAVGYRGAQSAAQFRRGPPGRAVRPDQWRRPLPHQPVGPSHETHPLDHPRTAPRHAHQRTRVWFRQGRWSYESAAAVHRCPPTSLSNSSWVDSRVRSA